MKPEKQQLIHDVLGNENRRDITLLAGAQVLRRRRHRRVAGRIIALALVLAATALWLEQGHSRRPAHQTAVQATRPAASGPARSLTDDELLALFPTNTPVGLTTLSNGKKRLIFPRPGDEKRFVIRL